MQAPMMPANPTPPPVVAPPLVAPQPLPAPPPIVGPVDSSSTASHLREASHHRWEAVVTGILTLLVGLLLGTIVPSKRSNRGAELSLDRIATHASTVASHSSAPSQPVPSVNDGLASLATLPPSRPSIREPEAADGAPNEDTDADTMATDPFASVDLSAPGIFDPVPETKVTKTKATTNDAAIASAESSPAFGELGEAFRDGDIQPVPSAEPPPEVAQATESPLPDDPADARNRIAKTNLEATIRAQEIVSEALGVEILQPDPMLVDNTNTKRAQPTRPAKQCDGGKCEPKLDAYGTALRWTETPADAYRMAKQQNKLVFLIHVSGNFKIPGFT